MEAEPIREFKVDRESKRVPLLDAPRDGYAAIKIGDGELSEYNVLVKWLRTSPVQEAFWEKGMFANRASACKLRNQCTLEKLKEHRKVDE